MGEKNGLGAFLEPKNSFVLGYLKGIFLEGGWWGVNKKKKCLNPKLGSFLEFFY